MFRVDYTVEAAGNKEFGSVFMQDGSTNENIALAVVQAGWAKVCGSVIVRLHARMRLRRETERVLQREYSVCSVLLCDDAAGP